MPQEIIEAPLTGKIISVECKAGDMVKEGDTICVMEAMKMEIPILTPQTGKITEIKVSPGQLIETGALITIIEY